MQPDEPRFKKLENAHFCDTVIVGITDHKSRQAEEEINGQKSMGNKVLAVIRVHPFHEMKCDHGESGNAAQAVKNFEMLFGF